jgi:hypothetical protein
VGATTAAGAVGADQRRDRLPSADEKAAPEIAPEGEASMNVSIIDPTAILLRARTESARLGVLPRWAPAFAGASAGTPILVSRLDKPDQYYYLVSFSIGARATARLRMNAQTGAFAEGIGIDNSGDALTPYITASQAYSRIGRVIAVDDKNKKKKKKPSTPAIVLTVEPFPGWRPCAQSFSAFLPFYLITDGTSLRYVRFDGMVYDALTFGAGL